MAKAVVRCFYSNATIDRGAHERKVSFGFAVVNACENLCVEKGEIVLLYPEFRCEKGIAGMPDFGDVISFNALNLYKGGSAYRWFIESKNSLNQVYRIVKNGKPIWQDNIGWLLLRWPLRSDHFDGLSEMLLSKDFIVELKTPDGWIQVLDPRPKYLSKMPSHAYGLNP